MSSGSRRVSSAHSLNSLPTTAAGMDETKSAQNSRRSGSDPMRRSSRLEAPARMSRIQSRQNTTSTATRVPQCSATSKARPGSCHPSSQGKRIRCALEEMGRNSESPCTMPRTMACATDMRGRCLRPLLPRRQVLLLLGRQLVDLDAHGAELQARDLTVDLGGHGVHLLLQLL